ncbi:MAG: recombinase family protein [Novosphingobium sp.]
MDGVEPRKALLYARVSTSDQEREGYSIPAQVKLLEDYAALKGLTIVGSHIDVETARKTGRIAFGEMLRYLRRHPDIRIVLVEKTDRLYRNLKDWATVDDLGIEIHFVKENFVLSDQCRSSEKFVHGLHVLMAKKYVDNLSEEATKGMREKARQGLWPSYAPLGYRNVVGTNGRKIVEIDPVTGPLVARLFEWFASGAYSLSSVTERARLIGLRGRHRGKPLGSAAVRHVLRNRFYTGSFDWAGETFVGSHETLVSVELWQAVQDILDGRASTNVRADPRIFPFSGLITCGHCDCAIVAEIKKERYVYYHCTGYRGKCPERYVREEVLQDKFLTTIGQLQCSDAEFTALQRELGVKAPQVGGSDTRSAFKRQDWFVDIPGSLLLDGIDLLDLARNAHRMLPRLPKEMKRQVLGLLLSRCTWAHERLSGTFHPPIVMFLQWLAGTRRQENGPQSERDLAALRNLFHDPSSDTLQLIARYNATMSYALEDGHGEPVSLTGGG